LEPTAEVITPASNLYAYVKDYQVYIFNPADLSVVRMGDANHPLVMTLIAGNLLPVFRWTVVTSPLR